MKVHLILLLILFHVAIAQPTATFMPVGNMTVPRVGHTATLLADGRVLIAGGYTDENAVEVGRAITATADLYTPATGTFGTAGRMNVPRSNHTATLLPDGRVLIAGGDQAEGSSQGSTSAELYDPSSGTFVATGSMNTARSNHSATLLSDGRVLIAGGDTAASASTVEIYDPGTGVFTSTLSAPGTFGTPSVLLPDGRVFILGSLQSEFYDPRTTEWRSATGSPIYTDRISLLPDGRVLVAGGADDPGASTSAAIFDPPAESFARTGSLIEPRSSFTVTLLPDGKTLFTGGRTWAGTTISGHQSMVYYCCLASAELYDPSTAGFTAAGNMIEPRNRHTATLLADGRVLIVGGSGGDSVSVLASAELYNPAAPVAAPQLFALQSDGRGQGAIWHANTGAVGSPDNPATEGEVLSMYTSRLIYGGVIPPQVAIGGQLAEVDYFGVAPGFSGYFQVNFRVPNGVAPGPAVPVRLTYLGRVSNEVTVGLR